MTKIKICGLREAWHAVTAAEVGADFLGFNFVEGVRRQISLDDALEILEEYRALEGTDGPKLVGLFANQPADHVNRIVRECGLDMAQLCGDEPQEYWSQIDVPIMKQVKVREDEDRDAVITNVLAEVERVVADGNMALLDKHSEGSLGGTGMSFDWEVAREIAKHYDFLLAGGLTPQNVAEAIKSVDPWGVDVSSGVETDGMKNPRKIMEFANMVRPVV